MHPPGPHHRFDRGFADMWTSSVVDVAEVLLGRRLPPGAVPLPRRLEPGPLEVDGLVIDENGTLVHVEFQTRADPSLGVRMARYWAALVADHRTTAPDQHVVLLHPDADRPSTGVLAHGRMRLGFEVHRLWEVDPDALASRPALLRLLPLAKASGAAARRELTLRAVDAIRTRLGGAEADGALYWTAQLATLYLSPAEIQAAFERNDVPIDLSHTSFAIETRQQARREAREETQRDAIRRVAAVRFGDDTVAARAAAVDNAFLDEGIDVVAAAATADDVVRWLESIGA